MNATSKPVPLSAAIAAALSAMLGCVTAPAPRAQLNDPGALLFNGYGDVRVDCYRCHAGDGTGNVRGPNLKELVPHLSSWRIWDQIEKGDGVMPAYENKLSEAQITDVVRWMRAGFPSRSTAPASAPRGQTLAGNP